MPRKHSTLLTLFIYFLVAMMLFSAIGVMVIYLKVPAQQAVDTSVTSTWTTENLIVVPELDSTSGSVDVLSGDNNEQAIVISTGVVATGN